jgi:hypothetical protein
MTIVEEKGGVYNLTIQHGMLFPVCEVSENIFIYTKPMVSAVSKNIEKSSS